MAADGQIVFEVTADGKHAIADIKDITRAIQQESGKWDRAAKESTDSISNNFSGMVKKLVAGFSAVKIGKELLDLGKQAIQAASDLAEVQNVVDSTFGSNSTAIDRWAKNAGQQFGLTETQAKRFTGTMGAMLKSMGMGGNEIVSISTSLSGLAADMASFYNLDFEESFAKIRSGLSGETEPLKQLGINMSAANLNAFALQKGLSKTFDQMSQSEQTMLRYQYLMQATADAQGDFAKTSDGYANGIRQLETNLESLKTNIGEVILPWVNDIVQGINSLFTPREGKTVLDDFADIDSETAKKLEQIKTTAEDARALVEQLDSLGNTETGKAGTRVHQLVESLSEINLDQSKAGVVKDFVNTLASDISTLADMQGTSNEEAKAWLEGIADSASKLDPADAAGWEKLVGVIKEGLPGFENTDLGASFFSALNGIEIGDKAQAVKDFIGTLGDNINKVAELRGTDAEEAKKWLESIGQAADSLDPADAAGWATLMDSIKEGLPGLENTEFGAKFFESLAGGFGGVKSQSSALEWAIDMLGNKTNKTAEEQAYWLEICKNLVKTIPGLSSIINTETGEIKGGTQAVLDYVKAWEEGQTKLALLGAIEQKESAISSRFADLPGLQLDAALAEKKVRDQKKKLDAIREKYGFTGDGYEMIIKTNATGGQGILTEAEKEWNDAVVVLGTLKKDANDANKAYQDQADALEEAKEAIVEYRKTVDEMPGVIEEATDATDEWLESTGKTPEQIAEIVTAAQEAVTAMEDYARGVHDSMMQAVNSVAKGLGGVDYRRYGNEIEKIQQLTEKQATYKVGSDEWKQLESEINKANEALVNTNNIYKQLEQQEAFLDDYIANLRKAREMGLSDALLAELSDGSVESAQYLDAIVNDKTGKTAAEIDEKYQEIQEKKAALAQELTQQQLAVDKTYQSLAEKAKEAVAALDLKGEAANNAGATVEGIAQGISSHVSEVSEAVNSIISELNRLNGYGIDIDFGGFGHIHFTTSAGEKAETSGRMGIPFVPRDDYLIRAHEGERLLTAQENQIWNALRGGGVAGFDLDSLGGVMRDNVRPGGDVFLDGRKVGSVISEQQGKSYRQLTRSGWQK